MARLFPDQRMKTRSHREKPTNGAISFLCSSPNHPVSLVASPNSFRIRFIQLSISAFNLFSSCKFSSVRLKRGSASAVCISSSQSFPTYRSSTNVCNRCAAIRASLICFRRPVDLASSNFPSIRPTKRRQIPVVEFAHIPYEGHGFHDAGSN